MALGQTQKYVAICTPNLHNKNFDNIIVKSFDNALDFTVGLETMLWYTGCKHSPNLVIKAMYCEGMELTFGRITGTGVVKIDLISKETGEYVTSLICD